MQWRRPHLKWLGAAAMVADHLALGLGESFFLYIPCRLFGRLSAPAMCLLLAEGYGHTSSRKRYALRLFLFALLSQPFYSFYIYRRFSWQPWNMIATLLLACLLLWGREVIRELRLRQTWTAVLLAATMFGDWGLTAPLWALAFYSCRGDRGTQTRAYLWISAATLLWDLVWAFTSRGGYAEAACQAGLFLFVPILRGYRPEGGAMKGWKWLFYLLYPGHFLVLWWVLRQLSVA